jgi:hypothetical protein
MSEPLKQGKKVSLKKTPEVSLKNSTLGWQGEKRRIYKD